MKEKTIEKIPYLGIKKTSGKKGIKYLGVTAVKRIDNRDYLFLEIYQNDRNHMDVPQERIVLTKGEFGTYLPEEGWNQKQIGNYIQGKDILISEEDIGRIGKYLNSFQVSEKNWIFEISLWQRKILKEKRRRAFESKWQRRRQALQERDNNTPELPVGRILEYSDRYIFHNRHYLFYKKKGSRATVTCSVCGNVTEGKWKAGDSYESQFESVMEEPRHKSLGHCPACGALGKYMPQGRVRLYIEESAHVFLGQQYRETGVVMRYIEVFKKYELEVAQGEKDIEMVGAREVLEGVEIVRVYFEKGKRMQKDFHKHSYYTGKDFWDDCNLSGLHSISIKAAPIMPETFMALENSYLRYSALKEYESVADKINPVEYLEIYANTPQIEMLVKLGLYGVVEELLHCHYRVVANIDGASPEKFLGIRKEMVKTLIKHRGDAGLLRIMQTEKRMGQQWTEKQMERLALIDIPERELEVILRLMSATQLLNRIEKYAGCGYETTCERAVNRLRATARTYMDYLSMRQSLGYNMSNTVYLHPRDLEAGHARMVEESNGKEVELRLQKVAVAFPAIRKNYRKLREKYFYENDGFVIRPARSAEEIVMEGRILHHCVGGDNYLGKHNDGRTVILMLRRKESLKIPYITVEIDSTTLRILQWYGSHDKKPDKNRMDKWLDNYCTWLTGTAAAGAGQADCILLNYA